MIEVGDVYEYQAATLMVGTTLTKYQRIEGRAVRVIGRCPIGFDYWKIVPAWGEPFPASVTEVEHYRACKENLKPLTEVPM